MDKLGWFIPSAALAAVVIAVRALFGKRMSPLVRCLIWLPLLLRMLIPGALFSAPVSVVNVTEGVAASLSEPAKDAEPAADTELRSPEPTPYPYGRPPEETPAQSAEPAAPAPQAAPSRIPLRTILIWVWGAGAAAVGIVFLTENIMLRNSLREKRKPLKQGIFGVYTVEGLDSSCLFLDSIYIPAGTEGDELRRVLAHERAHRRHLDGLWALFRCAALALHWFDPLAWWAAVLSRRDLEIFADAGAIASLGEDERVAYGETLIALSARYKKGVSPLCAATRMTGGKRALRERVENIASGRRTAFITAAAALIIAVAAAVCAFAGSPARATPAPQLVSSVPPGESSPLPPLPEARDCWMEDTFVISRDGDDFVISPSGSGATRRQVAETYLYDLKNDYPDFVDGPAALSGDIRLGMSYAEVMESLTGEPFEGEPDINLVIETDEFNSFAGDPCSMKFEFTRRFEGYGDSIPLYRITLNFDEGYEAETWFELYRRFTEAFGEPVYALSTEFFQNADELRPLLEDWSINPNVMWGASEKSLSVGLGGSGFGFHNISVVMEWWNMIPGQGTPPVGISQDERYNPDFAPMIYIRFPSPELSIHTVYDYKAALRGVASCEVLSVETDEELTRRNREALIGSELAGSRGVTDEEIEDGLEAVRVTYRIVYDETVPHMMGSGTYETMYLMLKDRKSGLWGIFDVLTPALVENAQGAPQG
ncbi:MAG: M56 family metallopeptidase [Oscillospiraceae bacterium]|nr:M56 family metallopeptidase [Oscillospiraceae bacterium]